MATLDELYPNNPGLDPHAKHLEGQACPKVIQGSYMTADPTQVTCLECLTKMARVTTPGEYPDSAAVPGDFPAAQVPAPEPAGLGTADILSALPFAYLSGAAGTGKTYLARQLRDQREDVLFTATTGIAAVNLGDATTINSALGYSTTQALMEHYASGFLAYKLRMLRKSGVRIIVVDEISMMEAQQLDIITSTLDEIDQKKAYDEDLEQVVWNVDDDRRLKLLLLGDFCQLAPVEGEFAFEGGAWSRFTVLTLTQNRRQADAGFIAGLHHVRAGRGEQALEYFRPYIVRDIDIHFDGATIAAKNDAVDRINNLRHLKVSGELYTFKTIRSGKQDKAWVKNIPEELGIKKGALVMILANKGFPKLDPEEMTTFEYVNGDLGTVVGQTSEGVRVMLHRTFQEVTVTHALKELKEPTGKKNPRWNIQGTCTYMPLRLAYGTTVHKCVASDTRIPVMGKGYLPIAQVEAGDTTPYGPVRAVVPTRQMAYRLTTKRGYSVVTSPEHRWMTQQGWKETQDLQEGDRLELNHGIPFPGERTLSWDQAWVLGAIVGDGCYTDLDDGTVELTCSHGAFGEIFRGRAETAFGVTPKWRKDARGLNWTKKSVRRQWEAWGLAYVKAPCKQIPWIIWQQGPMERGAFLSGLFDTDGHIGRQRVVLTTASDLLAQQVQEMLLTLGIISKRSNYPGVKDSTYWQVYVAAECRDRFIQWVGFTHPDKKERAQYRPNRSLRPALGFDRVDLVEPLGLELPMYDLEIDRPHILPFGPFLGHNSQGLTLDKVQVLITDSFFTHPGMLYVALSRARSLEGLRIVGNEKLFVGRCGVNDKVRPWL